MSNFVNIPLGLKTTTQIPLNTKEFAGSEALLKDLGLNDNLAFTYHKDLEVTCLAEGTKWKWREVEIGEENTGLLDIDFTYPPDLIAFGIDYSNKKYNFFKEIISIPDATSSVKGILKLTGALGGTADSPTTPTALHVTDNESWTGIKSSTNVGASLINGISLVNNGTGVSNSLSINNTSTGIGQTISNSGLGNGIYMTNSNAGMGLWLENSSSGRGLYSNNTLTGQGLWINNSNAGDGIYLNSSSTGRGLYMTLNNSSSGIVVNGSITSTGLLYIGRNNGTDTFSVNKIGNITANSYIKQGGTSSQFLMADGSVSTSTGNLQKVITYPADFTGTNYTLTNADNNYEIIIDNGATAVSITVPSGLTSKIGVGFTQKGTGDVSYVASGTTINNPIGLKIKGQYYQTFLSQEASTNIYYLGGNTKV